MRFNNFYFSGSDGVSFQKCIEMGSPLKCKYDFTKTFGPSVPSVFDSLICGHITFLVIGHDFREYLL